MLREELVQGSSKLPAALSMLAVRSEFIIIESVDSISRDGPDTPIYIIHYKKRNNSKEVKFKAFKP